MQSSTDPHTELESPLECVQRCHRRVGQDCKRHGSLLPTLRVGWLVIVCFRLVQTTVGTAIADASSRKKWCLDANAVAQEKGIEAVLAIVTNSGETSARCVGLCCAAALLVAHRCITDIDTDSVIGYGPKSFHLLLRRRSATRVQGQRRRPLTCVSCLSRSRTLARA